MRERVGVRPVLALRFEELRFLARRFELPGVQRVALEALRFLTRAAGWRAGLTADFRFAAFVVFFTVFFATFLAVLFTAAVRGFVRALCASEAGDAWRLVVTLRAEAAGVSTPRS